MRMMSVCWPSVGQAGDDCQGGCRGLPGTGVVGVAAGTIDLLDSAAQVHGICCPGNTLPSPKTGVDNVRTCGLVLPRRAFGRVGFRMFSRVRSVCKAAHV